MPYHTPLSNHFSLMVAKLDRDSLGSPFNRANSMEFLLSIDGWKLYLLAETGQLTSFAKNGIISLVLEVGSRCPYILKVSKWTVSWEKNEKVSVHKQKVRAITKTGQHTVESINVFIPLHFNTLVFHMLSTKRSTAINPWTEKAWFFHMLGNKTLLFKKNEYFSSSSDNIYHKKYNLTALEYEVKKRFSFNKHFNNAPRGEARVIYWSRRERRKTKDLSDQRTAL